MIKTILQAAAFSAIALSCAQAQETPVNLNGLVEKADATTLVVNADDASVQTLKFGPKILILQPRAVTLADIKPNDYVASAAVKKEDGENEETPFEAKQATPVDEKDIRHETRRRFQSPMERR